MYGLPDDFSTDFLLGRNLEQICINENQVYFHFDNQLFITVEGTYAYQNVESEAGELLIEVPRFDANVLQLLGSSVRKCASSPDGTLNLSFDNGQTLTMLDSSREFESYQIRYKDLIIIV
ncbi:MAG: DUF6188 family protein [Pyrinomonadaceae bacterium]